MVKLAFLWWEHHDYFQLGAPVWVTVGGSTTWLAMAATAAAAATWLDEEEPLDEPAEGGDTRLPGVRLCLLDATALKG